MKKRSLILSTALLLVAIMACTSATYAWFTANDSAKISKISAGVAEGSSLLLAGTANDPGDGSPEWKTNLDFTTINGYNANTIISDRSSVDGQKFFAREIDEENNTVSFKESADGILTFSFWVKSSKAGKLYLSTGELSSDNKAEEAARVAFISGENTFIWEPSQAETAVVADTSFKSSSISAVAEERVSAVESVAGGVASFAPQNQTYSIGSADAFIDTLVENTAKQITVKVWLEGQDKQCSNSITAADIAAQLTFKLA